MRAKIWYTPDPQQVELDLDADALADLLSECFKANAPMTLGHLGAALSSFHLLLKATPDELLAQWPKSTREGLAESVRAWADRLVDDRLVDWVQCDYCKAGQVDPQKVGVHLPMCDRCLEKRQDGQA